MVHGNKIRKFKSQHQTTSVQINEFHDGLGNGSIDREYANSTELTLSTLPVIAAPLPSLPLQFKVNGIPYRPPTTYGAHDVFRNDSSPSPTSFILAHASIVPVTCCGYTLVEIPYAHLRRLFKLAVPSVIGGVLGVLMSIVNLAFVGHSSSATLLGGCALGGAFMLITGYTVLLGLCSSIDTLVSQAHGANQHKLVGLIAQRAAVAYTLVIAPIILMWLYAGEFFLLAGQDPTISAIAGEYVYFCLPSILPILYSEIIKRYLQAQSLMMPQIYVALVANVIHAVAGYILLFQLNLGVRGASYALCVGLFSQLLLWFLYLRLFNRRVSRRTCPHIRCGDIFSGWGPLFKLGLPGMAMLLFEWTSFELCAIAAGWIGGIQLDTMVVFSNICTFLTMAPNSIGVATATLVGHAIGGGKHEHARMYSKAAAFLTIGFAGVEFIVLGSIHQFLARIFTTDPMVEEEFRQISICVALFVLFDCLQTVESGVLRGLGMQSFGATTNLFAYYAFGLPLGFLLCFHFNLGVPGLVIGLVLSVLSQTIVFALRLSSIDWEEETIAAARRMDEEQSKSKSGKLNSQSSFGGYRTPSDVSSDDDDQDEQADERQQYGFMH